MALLLVIPGALGAFAGLVLFFYFFTSVPLPEDIGGAGTVIYDHTGAEIATLQAEASREDVPLSTLPEHAIEAVLAAEDAHFYSHAGVSLPGIFRAAMVNVTSGEVAQGGSTISQQYMKNVTADNARTTMRKIREAALAVKLERQYSKDEILEFYLNSIYFGRGAYGIQAAALAYYRKDAVDLTQAEAVQLAGVIPSPSRLDPARNPEGAEQRYRYVLNQLRATGKIDAEQAGILAADMPATVPAGAIQFRDAPFFLDVVQSELAQRVGDEEIYQGLEVTTTLDMGVQAAAEKAYQEVLVAGAPEGATGALVALDPSTGGIRALVGGKDHAEDQVNMALAPRQPGSTFKPFALAAWIEQGKSPESYFAGPATYRMPGTGTDGKPYEIENYGGTAFGQLSLRKATWQSVNTVYAQLLEEVGGTSLVDLAERAGISAEMDPHDSSVVLGTTEVTPLELAEAYNTFAAGGMHHEPVAIERVERAGEVLYEASGEQERAMSEEVAWTVTEVLRGVVGENGTAERADFGRPAAGKTGTTTNHADAWFAGYTPQLTAVVWMGNRNDNREMPGKPTGGDLPAQVWRSFMARVHAGLDVADFPSAASSLQVVNPSPAPSPTVPTCGDDEVLNTSGTRCIEVEPTPTATPEPDLDPDPDPEPSPTPMNTAPPPTTVAPDPEPTETPAPESTPKPTEDSAPEPPPEDESSGNAAGEFRRPPDEGEGG